MYVAGHSGEITTAVRWSDEYNVLQQAKMAPRLWDVLMGSSHNERGFRQVEILPLSHKSGNVWTFICSRMHTIPIIL